MAKQGKAKAPLVWDGWIRLFHWSLVVLVVICWWTAEQAQMLYHQYAGYALLGLLIFRIYWGLFGSETARFSQFVTSPGKAMSYARNLGKGSPSHPRGHNPLGGYSVLALLGLLLVQVVLGLFAIDVDGFDGGPFSYEISFEAGRAFAYWHELNFNLLLGLIGLHVLAALFYLIWHRQNLITPMLHGRAKELQGAGIQTRPWHIALIGIFLAGTVVYTLLFWADIL